MPPATTTPRIARSASRLAVVGSGAALAWLLAGLGGVHPVSDAPEALAARRVTAPAGGSSRDLEVLPAPRLGEALCPENWPFAEPGDEPALSRQPQPSPGDPLRELTAIPAGMPISGWFSRGFGWHGDPWTGEREFHYGIDIGAEPGTEVRSAADGLVSRVGFEVDYGRVVDVDHGNGFVTRYAHLGAVLVLPGQPVLRGEPIGLAGSTGRSTGPHLHYEVVQNGRRVNPWNFIGTHGG